MKKENTKIIFQYINSLDCTAAVPAIMNCPFFSVICLFFSFLVLLFCILGVVCCCLLGMGLGGLLCPLVCGQLRKVQSHSVLCTWLLNQLFCSGIPDGRSLILES